MNMERNIESISLMAYLLPVAAHFGACSILCLILVTHEATFGKRYQMANDEYGNESSKLWHQNE
jgi:hypothetical protein